MSPHNILGQSLSNIHIASGETTGGGQDLPASISRSSSGKARVRVALGSFEAVDMTSTSVLYYPSQWEGVLQWEGVIVGRDYSGKGGVTIV